MFWAMLLLHRDSKVNKITFLILCGLQLVLIGGLRGSSVGTDTGSYIEIYNIFYHDDFVIHVGNEIGFVALMRFLRFFNLDAQWVLVATTLMFVLLMLKGIYHFSTNVWFSVFLLMTFAFYNLSIHLVRQFLTIAIFFYGYKYILNKNFIKYILAMLVAFSIHNSAILFLPLYLFALFNYDRRAMLKFFVILSIFLFNFYFIFGLIVTFFPRYLVYLDQESMFRFTGASYIAISMSALLLGIVVIFKTKNNKMLNLEFTMILFSLILTIIAANGFFNLLRFAFYFQIFSIIFIPRCISLINNAKIRTISYLFVALTSIAFYTFTLSTGAGVGGTVPYVFFFNE